MISIAAMISDSLGQHRRRVLDERGELRSAAYVLPPSEYRHGQPGRIAFDVDHQREVGSVEYLEINTDGALWAVGVADDNWLLTAHDVYASSDVLARRDGTDITLQGVALTHTPACVGLRPASIIPGDFRRSEIRSAWHNRTPARSLFERAAEFAKHHRRGDPIDIADLRALQVENVPGIGRVDGRGRRVTEARVAPWRGPGGAEIEIRPCGPILSVR